MFRRLLWSAAFAVVLAYLWINTRILQGGVERIRNQISDTLDPLPVAARWGIPAAFLILLMYFTAGRSGRR